MIVSCPCGRSEFGLFKIHYVLNSVCVYVCVCIKCVSIVCLCVPCACKSPWKSKAGIGYSGTGVVGGHVPNVDSGACTWVFLQEH